MINQVFFYRLKTIGKIDIDLNVSMFGLAFFSDMNKFSVLIGPFTFSTRFDSANTRHS